MDEWTVRKREVVRVADLAVARPVIERHRFEDCLIIGPAVLATTGDDGLIEGCTFDGDASSLVWLIPDDRPYVIGAIEAANCQFVNCRFSMVGFAGGADFQRMFTEGMT
ncbi:hypothetical protein [Microbacterium sp. NPDC080220]|uniref:hypothetical protein n=1 Tax=Microbacterium sp. NPDC080220 TaxID=3161017 RepID=UPI003429EFD7